MGHTTEPSRSSGAVIVLVIVLGLMLLVGAFVVGVGGYLLFRNTRVQQSMIARERAQLAEVQAREMQVRLEQVQQAAESEFQRVQSIVASQQAELSSSIDSVPAAVDVITIELDQNGEMQVGDKSIDLGALQAMLKEVIDHGGPPPPVNIRVDKRCLFEHVARVLSACREMKVRDIDVSARGE